MKYVSASSTGVTCASHLGCQCWCHAVCSLGELDCQDGGADRADALPALRPSLEVRCCTHAASCHSAPPTQTAASPTRPTQSTAHSSAPLVSPSRSPDLPELRAQLLLHRLEELPNSVPLAHADLAAMPSAIVVAVCDLQGLRLDGSLRRGCRGKQGGGRGGAKSGAQTVAD